VTVAPQNRAGRIGNDAPSHSLCADSASGPATPSLHGTSAAGRFAPFGVCYMQGATLAVARTGHPRIARVTGRDKPVPYGSLFPARRRAWFQRC